MNILCLVSPSFLPGVVKWIKSMNFLRAKNLALPFVLWELQCQCFLWDSSLRLKAVCDCRGGQRGCSSTFINQLRPGWSADAYYHEMFAIWLINCPGLSIQPLITIAWNYFQVFAITYFCGLKFASRNSSRILFAHMEYTAIPLTPMIKRFCISVFINRIAQYLKWNTMSYLMPYR